MLKKVTECTIRGLRQSAQDPHRIICRQFHNNKIGILGLPFSAGQGKPGVCKGPEVIRQAGLVQKLQELGNEVKDFGNLLLPNEIEANDEIEATWRNTGTTAKRPNLIGKYCEQVAQKVSEIEKDGYTCLTLGGDHSLGIGTLYGHMLNNSDMCVIWVDAHADINTTGTTTTGNVHGMPLSFLIKELHSYNLIHPSFNWIKPCLTAKDIVYIGLRDVDPLEKFILNKLGIKSYDMRDIDRYGIVAVMASVMDTINPRRNRPIHVSFDIDSLDNLVAPCTGTPVPGGLTLREGMYIAEEIGKNGKLCGLDLVEVNPDLGTPEEANKTVLAAHQIIMGFLGSERGGNMPLDINDIPLPSQPVEVQSLRGQS